MNLTIILRQLGSGADRFKNYWLQRHSTVHVHIYPFTFHIRSNLNLNRTLVPRLDPNVLHVNVHNWVQSILQSRSRSIDDTQVNWQTGEKKVVISLNPTQLGSLFIGNNVCFYCFTEEMNKRNPRLKKNKKSRSTLRSISSPTYQHHVIFLGFKKKSCHRWTKYHLQRCIYGHFFQVWMLF